MSKVLTVEYDAAENVLRLAEPLEGVRDHATLEVTLGEPAQPHPWEKLRGMVTKEQLDELEAIIEEEFPIER